MSGQPYRYASDPEKYRVEYMRNLNERTLLDQKVYDAVTNYIANGSLPAISQLPDTRSTSEKLLDIEGLKKGIINDFSEIMDSQTAIALIQGLIQSPLNIDNKLLVIEQNIAEPEWKVWKEGHEMVAFDTVKKFLFL